MMTRFCSLVRSMAVDIIAVDSVAALVPRAELEGEIGNVQARRLIKSGRRTALYMQLAVPILNALEKARASYCCSPCRLVPKLD